MSSLLRTLPQLSRTILRSRPRRTVAHSTWGSNNARSFTAAVTTHYTNRVPSQPSSPPGSRPRKPSRPTPAPQQDEVPNPQTSQSSSNRLPEFDLSKHIIVISGAARGLGLTQASALLEVGATVYALDRLPEPSASFSSLQTRAATTLNTKLHYRRVDVRDAAALNSTISAIADEEGRLDGLIAAAGIQQETSALDYTAEDADRMLSVNVTGVFITAQAVARQMLRLGTGGGSIALIAFMSSYVANRGLMCPAYNASKAAVMQLTRNLAAE